MAETAIAPAPPAPPPPATPTPAAPPATPPAPAKVKVADHIKRKFPDFAKVLEDEPIPVAAPLPDPNAPPKPKVFPRTLSEVIADDARDTAAAAAAAQPVAATPTPTTSAEPPAAPAAPAVKVTPKTPKVDVDKLVTERIAEALASQPAAPLPSATPPAPIAATHAPDPFEASLNEDQKERLEFARDAAKMDPTKYANLPAQTIAFFKAVDGYVQKKSGEEDGHDENSPEFIRFVQQNKPKISDGEIRRIEKQRILEEAKRSVREESNAELKATQDRIKEIEIKPKVELVRKDFADKSLRFMSDQKDPLTAPIIDKVLSDGWEKAVESDPLYGPVVQRIHGKATELAAAYTRLTHDPASFDGSNSDHKFLVDFIENNGQAFKANGGDARVKTENGVRKTFLPVMEFNDLRTRDPVKAQKYWTFNDFDILSRLAGAAFNEMSTAVKNQEETFKKAGYSRQQATQPAPQPAIPSTPTPAPAPATSPKTASSVAPGAAQTIKPISQMEHTMKMLGIKVPVPH